MFGQLVGDIPGMANNIEEVYEGDLRHYLRLVFDANNIHNGYHGLRHMLHVPWVCYQAGKFYRNENALTARQVRNLLVAALFHDYDHAGVPRDDSINIEVAIKALRKALLPEDVQYAEEIERIIRATQFPHKEIADMTLEEGIIRDADMTQAFGPVWIGDIIGGFGRELGKTPVEMLEQQLKFLDGVEFHTSFGNMFYGQAAIAAKRKEVKELFEILSI